VLWWQLQVKRFSASHSWGTWQPRCGHLRHRASSYNILGEKLKSGPAARGMDRFAVSIGQDGVIVVDTGQVTAGAPNLGPDHLTFSDPFPWDAACR
jgi:hypothetical protein